MSFFAILVMTVTACGPAKSAEKAGDPLPQAVDAIRALSAKYPAKTVNLLLSRMQAGLPKGWRASYEKDYSVLVISRDEAVLATRVFINGPPDQKPDRTKFAFAFRVVPVVSPAEHRRLNTDNGRIQKELSALYEVLKKKGLAAKFDSFSGKTDEDKAAVARYDALKKSLHELPNFYFEEISLEWLYGWLEVRDWGVDIDIEDERIREECTQVQKKILSLLSKYEGA